MLNFNISKVAQRNRDKLSRSRNFPKATVQHKPGSTPPLWNLTTAGYPKCIPVDSPVPVQQADAHLDGRPLKKNCWLNGRRPVTPSSIFFQVFPLISVSQSSHPVPMHDWAFCDVSGTKVQKAPLSPWNQWPLNKLTALNNKALTLTFPSFFFGYCNGPRDHISCAK